MKINNKIASFIVGFVFIFIVGVAIAQTPNPGHTATQIGEGTIGNTLTISNGKVGIGTTNPLVPLDIGIAGGIKVVGGDSGTVLTIPNVEQTFYLTYRSRSVNFYTDGSGGTILTMKSDGNVGIGTTSPTEKLDVIGNIKGSGLCIGSDCRTSWPTSATSQWVTSGANIYYNAGSVGIGTGAPAYTLQVAGTTFLQGAPGVFGLLVDSIGRVGIGTINPSYLLTLGGNNPTIALSGTESGAKTFTISEEGASLWIRDLSSAARLQIDSAGGFNFQSGNLITTGNVGIGTASPTEKLEISGNAKIQGNLQVSGTITGNVLKGSRRTTICINTNYQPFVDQSCTNGEVGDGNWKRIVTANCPAGTLLIGGIADSSRALTSTFDYINNKHICNFAGDIGDWGKCTAFCSN